eukprot:gene10729-2819_t
MQRFLKEKKVVLVLNGRYAGKKAVIINHTEDGDGRRPFGHCLIAGLERGPRKITKQMGTKKKSKRSRVKPFLKIVNANHIMPTRYSLSVEFNKKIVTKDCVKDPLQERKERMVLQQASILSAIFSFDLSNGTSRASGHTSLTDENAAVTRSQREHCLT